MDVGDSLGVYDAKLLVESMMRECLEQEVGYVWSCPEERIFLRISISVLETTPFFILNTPACLCANFSN